MFLELSITFIHKVLKNIDYAKLLSIKISCCTIVILCFVFSKFSFTRLTRSQAPDQSHSEGVVSLGAAPVGGAGARMSSSGGSGGTGGPGDLAPSDNSNSSSNSSPAGGGQGTPGDAAGAGAGGPIPASLLGPGAALSAALGEVGEGEEADMGRLQVMIIIHYYLQGVP